MRYLLSSLLFLWMTIVSFGIKVNYVYKWKYVDFMWESDEQKEDAINSGTYNRSAYNRYTMQTRLKVNGW